MHPQLPPLLDRYVAAQNAHDAAALAACFAPNARVRDEGKEMNGAVEIQAWAEETGARYRATLEPMAISTDAGRTALVARVSGDFVGSPANLVFHFDLSDDRIQALEVTA